MKAKTYVNQGKAKTPLCRQEQAPASVWPESPIFYSTGKGEGVCTILGTVRMTAFLGY